MQAQGKRLLTYEEIRELPCPLCQAGRDEKCRRPGWELQKKPRHMEDVHVERYQAAARRRDESEQAHRS